MKKQIEQIKEAIETISKLDLEDQVLFQNAAKQLLHQASPFAHEPVDLVMWVKSDKVVANDYNPNKVAPPEMQLLEVSIDNDGYTQPIVTYPVDGNCEVIDGFHRSRVGKESPVISKRVHGYLPVVAIRDEQSDKNDRIASTIRHNRARGKHQVDAMSEIVLELKNRNWTNKRIAKQLGMDEDEILRLCQISGLEHMFSDADFSKAWVAEDTSSDFEELTEEFEDSEEYGRTANTNDPTRIFHTHDKWECVKAGFYATKVDGKKADDLKQEFASLLKDSNAFRSAANSVVNEWVHSTEHYLTNKAMNRIAWMGQAAVCYAKGVPSQFSSGWSLLTEDQQNTANEVALEVINNWMIANDRPELTMEEALSEGRQVEIY